MMRNNQRQDKQNKGFTLVELIVVLVILAILAAVLIPALLGYIDSARKKQYVINAKACLTAAQAEFSAAYAKYGDTPLNTLLVKNPRNKSDKNGDQDIRGSEMANRIMTLADMTGEKEPFLFMVAVGSNWKKNMQGGTNGVTAHDKYTVYYALYMENKDATPLYYYNGTWTEMNPRQKGTTEIFSQYNYVKSGSLKDKRLQYYLISLSEQCLYTDKSIDNADFWSWLKGEKTEYLKK